MTTDTDKLAERLPKSIYDFEEFLNEPSQYEDLKKVREYRHEAYYKWCLVLADIKAALSSPPAQSGSDHETRTAMIVDAIIRDIAELPDRTSPEGQPDVMLVSDGELRNVLWRHLERASGGTDGY